MVALRKPSERSLGLLAQEQAGLELTYDAVGATAGQPPPGFVVDRTRHRLGEGEECYRRARTALLNWRQFDLGWLEAWPPRAAIREGSVVIVLARAAGMWWSNPCRIVYVIEESGPVSRFGFAYGTLPLHAGRGEERFLVEWNRSDDSVWFDILAFSRPRHPLTWLGYPLVRATQRRFGREASAAMARAVALPPS